MSDQPVPMTTLELIEVTRTQPHRQWCVRISGEMHERDNPCDCGKTIADVLVAHIDTLTPKGEVPLVTTTLEMVKMLFDIAVGSMDFGSGFLEDADVEVLRFFAVTIGVDPMEGTPQNFRTKYAHEFVQRPTPPWWDVEERGEYVTNPRSNGWRCELCNAARDHTVHGGEGKLLGAPGSN